MVREQWWLEDSRASGKAEAVGGRLEEWWSVEVGGLARVA